ncbi:hypothetical protein CYMTET_40548 [Cymbomonas tetramitiformis]|uniref:DNA2/NAM7 helicase helicase domain-containing protein n=1 Tax=Cymbomonas tetramitiformis TaxID=36881 RepID=A0AAE0C7V2_9CHLO|nr:hypothetical protein CYMTET_40548 [Cymbomonas tetramitiformis]
MVQVGGPALNQEQQQAVDDILRGDARGSIYVLFGPPGTGKTITVVNAIVNILAADSTAQVCVCTPAAFAADVVCSKLADLGLQPLHRGGSMVRINDPRRAMNSVKGDVVPFCCFAPKPLVRPIPVSALGPEAARRSGWCEKEERLVQQTMRFRATAAEAFIPLTLAKSCPEGQCTMVLAGDPHQLGPSAHSAAVRAAAADVSLQEAVMAAAGGMPGSRLHAPTARPLWIAGDLGDDDGTPPRACPEVQPELAEATPLDPVIAAATKLKLLEPQASYQDLSFTDAHLRAMQGHAPAKTLKKLKRSWHLGNTAAQGGDHLQALQSYSNAIEIVLKMSDEAPREGRSMFHGVHASLLAARSDVQARRGEHAKGLADAERCVELQPHWGTGYIRSAAALAAAGRLGAAADALRRGLQGHPEHVQFVRLLHCLQGLDSGAARKKPVIAWFHTQSAAKKMTAAEAVASKAVMSHQATSDGKPTVADRAAAAEEEPVEAARGLPCRRTMVTLVRNYRSHPDILHLPSKLFYGGALQAATPEDQLSLPEVSPSPPASSMPQRVDRCCAVPETRPAAPRRPGRPEAHHCARNFPRKGATTAFPQ